MAGAGGAAPPSPGISEDISLLCVFAPSEVVQPLGVMNSSRALFLSERNGQRQPSPGCVCREKKEGKRAITSLPTQAWDDLHMKQHGEGLWEGGRRRTTLVKLLEIKIRKQATEETAAEPGTVIPQHGPMLCQRGEGFSVPLLSVFYTAASSFKPSVTGDRPAMREGNLTRGARAGTPSYRQRSKTWSWRP